MANKRFIDFPIATTVGDNDIILIWQGGANKQTTKATILSGVPDSLNDLTDVTISGLTNGQILRYDSVTGQWENTDQGNLDLNDLNDVTIVSPTNGQVLVYNSSTSKWENSSGGYVPYVGAVTTVDLGLQGLEAGYVRFDTSIVSVPDEQGLMYWDASRSTVALIMNGTLQHIGQDTFFYVKNSSGSSIPKGTCVRFAGTDGASGHLLITPFLANGSVPSTYFLGVTAEEITNGSFGQVMHFGELEGINTSSYTAGDLLYASTTVAGAFQTTAPVAPNNIVLVAAAVNSKNNGAIVVRPTYGSNINDDEGVKITSPTTGQLLQLQAGGLWENKTLAQVLGGTSSQFVKGDGSLDSTSYGTGTVTSVGLSSATSGVTIGSTPVTTSGTITLAIATASGSQNGLLSSADWSTFNAKQPAGNYVTLDTTQTITGQKTISRVASSYNGTVQSILIDGSDGNGALTINSNGSSPFAYQTFAQSGIGKFELGVVGTSGNGSFYINRTIQTGETGASIYIKKSDGFVGINNINPTFQLDVTGTSRINGALTADTTTITNGTRSWIISPSGASINHEFAGVIEGKIDPSSGGNSWFGATSGTTGAGAKHYFASNGAATFASTVTASSFIRVGGTSSQFLKADGSVDSTSYLPLGGGTMTGPITTPNGTFGIVIGDDSRLADRNVANTLFLEGIQNNDRGYINFSQTTGNALGAINGGDLTWRGSTVWTSANITPVTSVTASSPLASSGGTTPNITIQQASGSQSGFLSSTDWTTFNNKQNAGNYVTLDTTQTITAAKTFSLDIIVNGVNVGRGGGNFITSTRVGVGALQANTTGEQNTAVGESALLVNTTGSNNSSFGRMSLFSNTSGSANTAIGTAALNSNTIGIYNSGFGFAALGNNTTGNYNTGVGNFAGTSTNAGSNNTTSSDSVYIGYDTRASASGNTNEIVIGSGGRGEGSNTAVIGNSSITKTILRTNLGVGTNGPATFLHVAGTSAKALTGLFHTCIQDFTSMATGVGGGITFMGYKTAQSAQEAFAGIDGFKENGTAGNAAGAFRILTQPSSGAGLVEQIRFTSDGYTRLSSTAGGIQFNGDTAAANALDDYEEGEFSPTIIGSSTAGTVTYNARNGLYTKIGRAVSFNLYVDWSSGTGSGNLRLSGLPFTASATGVYPAVAIGEISAIALSANTIATARVQISTNEIWFGQAVVGGGFNSSLAYDGAGYIVLSGTYYI